MLTIRPAAERGYTELDWLKSHHTFSFDQFSDPDHMHFGPLRIINEDYVAPGAGFGMHPHRDMEIITYVIAGEAQHRDSLGSGSVIKAGEIQKMSAGSGILHSEFNPSQRQELHLLQIWIIPNKHNLTPKYEQERFNLEYGKPLLLGGPAGGLVSIRQNINLYGLSLLSRTKYQHALSLGNKTWIQVVKGECQVHGQSMKAGDGLGIEDVDLIDIQASLETELLLFEIFV